MGDASAEPGLDALRIDRKRRRGGRRRGRLIVGALSLIAALAVALALLLLARPPSVAVAEVREARPGEAQTQLSASGYVATRHRSIVAPRIPGRLAAVLVEEGQRVRAGQVIARLDDEDARAALSQAEARADAAEARLAAARVASEQASRNREREAADDASRTATADALAAAAELAAARAAIEGARLQLEQTEIRAPFDGTVVRKLADVGAVLAPAAISELDVGGVVEVVDLDALEVEAEVSEEELPRLHEGQPALIFLDAYPDVVHRGVLAAVRPSIDRSKATAVVKVRFSDSPRGALPNMGARVAFLAQPLDAEALQREPRLRLPASAVVERDGAPVVLVVEGGRVHRAPVAVAATVGDEVALAAGPPPGSRVVAAPTPRLDGGARVRVQESAP